MTYADKDKLYVWHPFTPMTPWCRGEPLVIERGQGNYLIDTNGNRYLDGVSSLWVTVHGHCHPVIDQAIRDQLDKIAHSTLLGLANTPSIDLAERLVSVAPAGLTKVFFSDNGSTAVEVAAKMAFQYWVHRGRPEKRRFVSLDHAYHGDTLGAVSMGGIDLFHRIFAPLLFEVLHTPTPYWYRHPVAREPEACRDHCLAELRRLLVQHGDTVAALVIEPLVQGAAGMLVQPPGFLHGVADLCRAHDVLLICDEVATGFGRTGTMFACEQEDVAPDFLCLAKGITGGYLPLAATLTSDAVYDAFCGDPGAQRTFFHGHTYTGNPLACAAAIASFDLFVAENTLAHVAQVAAVLGDELARHVVGLDHVGEVRRRGLMVGIELVRDRRTRESFPAERAIGAEVCQALRAEGILLRPLGPVVVLMPPLSITPDEVRRLVGATSRAIARVS